MTNEATEDIKKIALRLPAKLHERIIPLAKKNHRSVHGQIVAMIEERVEREEAVQERNANSEYRARGRMEDEGGPIHD